MTQGGTVQVRICAAEVCQSVGAEGLIADAERLVGARLGKTTADGRIKLTEARCLGDCELAPTVAIGSEIHGFMDAEQLARLIAEATGSSAG